LDPSFFTPFIPSAGKGIPAQGFDHADFKAKLERETATSKEEFVAHYRAKYTSEEHEEHLPIWMATELLTLGTISKMAGFTDHVFALCHLLGFRFAPRIRDLADKRLYVPGKPAQWSALGSMIGGSINTKIIGQQLSEVLRLAASIQHGTVTASLILRKLGSYPRQNSLALALREIGRIERTLFMLAWLEDPALRRRVTAGLNKGEARNALARAVFFNRLGEIRDRSFENQRHRASGLNLVVAAITLWNTVYLERATGQMTKSWQVEPALLQHVSPLGWEHINLTGDYTWHTNKRVAKGGFRPLRGPRNGSGGP
jgi:hypothetical protein